MCLKSGERGSNGVHCSILLAYRVQLIPGSELQQRRTGSSPEDDVLHMRSAYSCRSTSVSLVENEIQLSVVWCWAMPKNVKRDTVDSRNTHCELSWTTRIHTSRMRTTRWLTVSRSIPQGGGEGGVIWIIPPICRPHPDADPPHADPPVMWPVMHAEKPTPPLDADPPPRTEWQTGVKILPPLRVVIKKQKTMSSCKLV